MIEEQQKSSPNFDFFPILNPNLLLLCSFDIPQPIIHPPGTDSCSLSNPNLHGNDRLEPFPALDIYPSAASRSEIITKTTDLTASEHAGRTLCETTKTSTNPRSPGNSGVGVVTQHAVNDLKVKTIQSENTRSIECDIYNITCNGEDILEKHKQENKHLKNLQKPEVSSSVTQEMPPPIANTSLFCDVSDVGSNIQDVFIKHLEGKKHVVQATLVPNPGSVPSVQPSNSGSQEARDKVNIGQSVWCEVCKVSCNSEKDFSKHVSGKKHQKKLKVSEQILIMPLTPVASSATTPITEPVENLKSTEDEIVISNLCKVNCSSNVLSGDMKNIQESEKIPGLPSTAIASVTKPPIAEPAENPKSTKDEIVISKKGEAAWCNLCNAGCSSNVLSRHILGKKHQKNLAKSKKIPDSPSTLIALVATPPTGPAENPKSTKGKIVNSGKESEKIPVLPSTPIASVTTPSTGLVVNPKLTKGEFVNSDEESEKIPVSSSTHIASMTTPPTGPVVNPKSTKGKIVNSEEVKSAWCELCGVDCGTNYMMKEHISGKKHRKNMKKSEKLKPIGPSPFPAAEPPMTEPLQDSGNKEGKMVILQSCKRKSNSSNASHEDADTKRQKTIEGGASIICTLQCGL